MLLSRWSRWPRLKPDARVGLLIIAVWVLPVAVLALVRHGIPAGTALVALVLALSTTALWWVVFGQRLDAAEHESAAT